MNTKEVMMTIIGLAKVCKRAIKFDREKEEEEEEEDRSNCQMYAYVCIHKACVKWILLMIRPTPIVPFSLRNVTCK